MAQPTTVFPDGFFPAAKVESSIDWIMTYTVLTAVFYAVLALVLTVAIAGCLKSIQHYFYSRSALLREELRAMRAGPGQPPPPAAGSPNPQ